MSDTTFKKGTVSAKQYRRLKKDFSDSLVVLKVCAHCQKIYPPEAPIQPCVCPKCKDLIYCDQECFKQAWPKHQSKCGKIEIHDVPEDVSKKLYFLIADDWAFRRGCKIEGFYTFIYDENYKTSGSIGTLDYFSPERAKSLGIENELAMRSVEMNLALPPEKRIHIVIILNYKQGWSTVKTFEQSRDYRAWRLTNPFIL
jgi:hypothetical protein